MPEDWLTRHVRKTTSAPDERGLIDTRSAYSLVRHTSYVTDVSFRTRPFKNFIGHTFLSAFKDCFSVVVAACACANWYFKLGGKRKLPYVIKMS